MLFGSYYLFPGALRSDAMLTLLRRVPTASQDFENLWFLIFCLLSYPFGFSAYGFGFEIYLVLVIWFLLFVPRRFAFRCDADPPASGADRISGFR
ncbi:MAG TPA: hypothetical protein PLH26_19980, partial [Agriterribacter sp.]|nr:hypothetical protein [Agriterribacter sp.]